MSFIGWFWNLSPGVFDLVDQFLLEGFWVLPLFDKISDDKYYLFGSLRPEELEVEF